MSKKTLILSSLILALLGFFFLLEIFLPSFVAGKIRKEIEEGFRGEITVKTLEVNSKPALKLLLGKAESVTFEATGLSLGELEVEELELVLEEVEINFLQKGKPQVSVLDQAKALSGSMLITEAALNRLISKEGFLPLKNTKLDLKEKRILLRGTTILLNNSVEVEVIGSFKVAPGNTIVFHPTDLQVAGFKAPAFLKEGLLKQISFQMTLEDIPMDLKLQKIELYENRARIIIQK